MNNKEKSLYISVAQVLSCLSVVILHVNGNFWSFTGDASWIKANIIECFFYPAAPIFFMISGATLLDYRDRYDTKTFLKKRIKRTLLPFIVWSFIGLLYQLLKNSLDITSLTTKDVASSIINTKYVPVYWFFIPLFTIYILIIMISLVPKDGRKKVFYYFSLFSIVLSIINVLFSFIGIQFNGALSNGLVSYSVLVLLGYCISTFPIERRQRVLIYILGLLGFLLHVLGTMYLSLDKGEIVNVFKGYTNFPCVLHTVAIFTLIKYLPYERFPKITRIVEYLSQATLGVYLIHWFLIDTIISHLKMIDLTRLSYKTIAVVVVFSLSVLLTKLIKRVPIIRNIC